MEYVCKKCGKIFKHPTLIGRHYAKNHRTQLGRVYKVIRKNQHYVTR